MKVILDQNKCIGCGACVAISPENFDFVEEEGVSTVKNEEVTDKTYEAKDSCPVYAIDVVEDEEKAA